MEQASRVIAGVGLADAPRKSRWPARMDLAQSLTDLALGLFMWGHMFFVSSILISKDAMWTINLCGSHDTTLLYKSTLVKESLDSDDFRCTSASYGIHPPIVRCNVCGLVYANPRWQASLVEDNYSIVEDPVYIEEREGRVITFQRNLAPFEKLVGQQSSTRRLLDVGCHIGVMVELAQARGWEAWRIEPSEWASQHARERGLHVITGTLNSAEVPQEYFDAVTMWDVVEHLTDPAREICNAFNG